MDFPLKSEMHYAAPKKKEPAKSPRLRSPPQPWELDPMKTPYKWIFTHKLDVRVCLLTKYDIIQHLMKRSVQI